MTEVSAATRPRFSGKFLAAIAVVFGVQFALIFGLSDRRIPLVRTPVKAPAFQLGDPRPPQLAALEDPTLFVLPHAQSFSGGVWTKVPQLEFSSRNWSEPLRWLALPREQLGLEFIQYVRDHPPAPFETILMPEPTLTLPPVSPTRSVPGPSRVFIEGELAGRRLLYLPEIPLQPSNVALSSSVVQIVVNAEGEVFSTLLELPGSGSKEADQDALRIAQDVRFESIEPVGPSSVLAPKPKLMLGTMIFAWQTTNSQVILP